MNTIFTNEKLEKSDELFDAVNNTKKNVGYELNTLTTSDAQVGLASDSDTVTHTSNGISDHKLLSFWTIREVSFLPPPTKLSIDAIELAPQTLMTTAAQEISADKASGNMWTNRTPGQIIRTGIDRYIPISTQIHSGISKTSTPYSSNITGTRISIGASVTSTTPPSEDI